MTIRRRGPTPDELAQAQARHEARTLAIANAAVAAGLALMRDAPPGSPVPAWWRELAPLTLAGRDAVRARVAEVARALEARAERRPTILGPDGRPARLERPSVVLPGTPSGLLPPRARGGRS